VTIELLTGGVDCAVGVGELAGVGVGVCLGRLRRLRFLTPGVAVGVGVGVAVGVRVADGSIRGGGLDVMKGKYSHAANVSSIADSKISSRADFT